MERWRVLVVCAVVTSCIFVVHNNSPSISVNQADFPNNQHVLLEYGTGNPSRLNQCCAEGPDWDPGEPVYTGLRSTNTQDPEVNDLKSRG